MGLSPVEISTNQFKKGYTPMETGIDQLKQMLT